MSEEATANEPIVTSNVESASDENPREQEVQKTAEAGDEQAKDETVEKKSDDEQSTEDEEARRSRRRERNNRRATKHIKKIESENQQLREQLAYERGQREALQRSQQPDEMPPRPQREDYLTEDEHLDAVLDWREEIKARDQKDEVRQEEPKPAETQQIDQPAIAQPDEIESYMKNGRDRYGEDFDDMLDAAENNEFSVSPMMAQVIFQSEQGAAISMHLYNNPGEADRIAGLPGAQQVREIVKLETQFVQQANTPPKRTTNAPPPGEPESGSSMHEVDPNKMGMEDYARYRQKQRGEIQ